MFVSRKEGVAIFLLALLLNVKTVVCNKELRILGLLPMTGDAWPGGWPCLVAIEMAVEGINQHPDLLNGYTLTYDYIDHECIPGRAVYKMARKLEEHKPYVMIIGPIMSPIGTATAEVSCNWNLTQLGFATSSPVLSDKERFQKFYRLSAPDRKMNVARIGLMKAFNWRKVATIHHSIEFFSMVIDEFVREVYDSNITVISQQIFLHDPYTQVLELKKIDARIIMTAMYEDRANMLLCQAYKVGLYGPKIVWYFLGYYSDEFWKRNLDNIECTEAEMSAAVEGSIHINNLVVNPEMKRGVANLTYAEFWSTFYKHPKYDPAKKIYERQANRCFDGTWAAALALNCSVSRLKESDCKKTLDEFTYTDSVISETIYRCMGDTRFTGVAKDYAFSIDGEIEDNVIIDRIQDGKLVHVATYRRDINPHSLVWIEGALQWKNGKVPKDSTNIITLEQVIPPSIYITTCACSTIGILLALSLFTFNVYFRDNRHVKMSSPNINSFLLFGCVVSYISVYIKPVGVTYGFACKLRTFFFCMGFTITFGSLFSKTWRVYRIFTNKKLMRMSIKDRQLFAINGVLVVVVLVVLVVWEFVSPHQVIIHRLKSEVYTDDNEDEIHPFISVCSSQSTSYFSWLVYFMGGALLTFGAFLAWETRNVNIAALNDSHQIGFCLYNVVILSAVGLTLSLVLDGREIVLYAATSACLIIGITLTKLIVFIPKIHAVYRKVQTCGPTTAVPKPQYGSKGSHGPSNAACNGI